MNPETRTKVHIFFSFPYPDINVGAMHKPLFKPRREILTKKETNAHN
jgi:hypothetical protein